jgi:hypothetical protein
MGKAATLVLMLAIPVVSEVEGFGAQSPASKIRALQSGTRTMPRVRTTDSTIANLIARASDRSATFRHVVEVIDATDGIVYVEPGRCRHSVRACLVLTMQIAGPNRLLRILVDSRKVDCNLMASIGHELWHAIEVLREPSITNDAALFLFYMREGHHTGRDGDPLGAWETNAALQTGLNVLAELKAHANEEVASCRSNRSR